MGPNINIILNINKPLGLTSYDVIRILKKKYIGQKIGHAGTLDPLAEGVLICLVGKEATKRQSEFMGFDKEYEFEVLFGFKTDTFDILGLVTERTEYDPKTVFDDLKKSLKKFIGFIKQPVPPFSAVKVGGKPLYRLSLANEINKIQIPVKEICINNIEIIENKIVSTEDLITNINGLLNTVRSGFRQDEVKKSWQENLSGERNYLLATLRASVSKGTYVRAIADQLGGELGVGACTLKIKRTKVGEFTLQDSINTENI